MEMMDIDMDNDIDDGQNKGYLNNESVIEVNPTQLLSFNNKHDRKILVPKRSLRASRSLMNASSSHASTHASSHVSFCVIDTNILLAHLNEFKHILVNEEKRKSIRLQFIIPWIVVQELDSLKNKQTLDAMNAIRFINEQLTINHLVRGENKAQSSEGCIQEENNDDKIINCCLKMIESNVILISNDINLRNKALMVDIKCFSWQQFVEFINKQKDHSSTYEQKVMPISTSVLKGPLKRTYDDTSIPTKSSTRCKSNTVERQQLDAIKSQLKNEDSSFSQSPTKRRKGVSSTPKDKLSKSPVKKIEWIPFKYECESKLLDFIKAQYQSIWKEQWEVMLDLNVKTASLKDMIRIIRKEWQSIFSDSFNRDNRLENMIDDLHQLLKNENNHDALIPKLSSFLDFINKNDSLKYNFNETDKN